MIPENNFPDFIALAIQFHLSYVPKQYINGTACQLLLACLPLLVTMYCLIS